MNSPRYASLAIIAGILAAVTPAMAQSVTPMRGETKSFQDSFALRVVVGNPYANTQTFNIRVYDEKFLPIASRISLPNVKVGSQASRAVLVIVPFEKARQRKVRVCAEALFQTDKTYRLRTQVCGKFLATYLGS